MPTTNLPKMVSVLVRTKNRLALLLDALRSVVAQDYPVIEIVIVNDGADDIEPSLKLFFGESETKWKLFSFNESLGRSSAANKAMELAVGDYFLFLDDDDLLCESHLSNLVLALEDRSELIGAYSATQCVQSAKCGVVNVNEFYAEEYDPIKLAYENYLPIHSVLFKRKAYDDGCRFEKSLSLYEDWHFWLQVIRLGELKFVNKYTALYRVDSSGIGRPGQNIDRNDQWLEFLKHACDSWEEKQISHLVYSAKELKRCQQLLEAANEKLGSLERQGLLLKEHNDSLLKINEKLESQYLTLDLDYDVVVKEKDRLEDAKTNLRSDFSRLNENYKSLEKERDRLAEAQTVLVSHCSLLEKNTKKLEESIKELESTHQTMDAERLRENGRLLADLGAAQQELERFRRFSVVYRLKRLVSTVGQAHPGFASRVNKLKKLIVRAKSVLPKYAKEFFRLVFAGEALTAFKKAKIKINNALFSKTIERAVLPENLKGTVSILATKHTLYVAELVKRSLCSLGFDRVQILDPDVEDFGAELHIVVCPQMFKKLPGLYISFQMEQSVSSRWFSKQYFSVLENSLAVMDYSQPNIRFLQEEGGLHYKQLFWTPISSISGFRKEIVLPEKSERPYEVAFYGDPNAERRQEFLKCLKERFSVLVISEVFGEELYRSLAQAQVVVNVHYYEGALLETTRIYECLSLGLNIVSEDSSDMDQHASLQGHVQFTPVGDMDAMCDAVRTMINKPSDIRPIPDDNENFHYYFSRMLLAVDVLPHHILNDLPIYPKAEDLQKRIILTLPETYDRHNAAKGRLSDCTFYSGLRHFDGWLGAALSYKFLAQRAIAEGIDCLEIAEDDVALKDDFERNYSTAKRFLFEKLGVDNWDVFCGLIADVGDTAKIIAVYEFEGVQYVQLDMMTSMVFNIYNKNTIKLLSEWDSADTDVETNTIDRYLENKSLRVIASLPYLVGHLPEHISSIWHFENSTYDDLIEKSEKKLIKKVQLYLESNRVISL